MFLFYPRHQSGKSMNKTMYINVIPMNISPFCQLFILHRNDSVFLQNRKTKSYHILQFKIYIVYLQCFSK